MSATRSIGKLVFKDVLWGVLATPVFWYTRGLVSAAHYSLHLLMIGWQYLTIQVWARNLFVPMFGQRDATGIIISFFVRLFQVLVRGAVSVVWLVVVALLFVAYLAAPIVIVWKLI